MEWNEQGKIRIRESTEAQLKHLMVKTMVAFYIKFKHRKKSRVVKIYTEWPVVEGKICDVYYENSWDKEAVAYEIRMSVNAKWLQKTKEAYKGWEVYGIKNPEYVVIDLTKISNNLTEMAKQIKEIVI